MRLDLSEIAVHLGKRISYTIDEPPVEDLGEGMRSVGRVAGKVTFTNTGLNIVTRGSFRTAVEVECARCLRVFRVEIESPIQEELPLRSRPAELGEETCEELPEEEREPLFVDNIFDLDELLRQSIVIAIPIKPICSEDCKGLCPHCGADLNKGQCDCPNDEAEGPFAALASLLENEEE